MESGAQATLRVSGSGLWWIHMDTGSTGVMWFSMIPPGQRTWCAEKWLLPFVNMLGRMARTSRIITSHWVMATLEVSHFESPGVSRRCHNGSKRSKTGEMWLLQLSCRNMFERVDIFDGPGNCRFFCSENGYFSAAHHSWSNQPSFLGVDPDFNPILILQGFLVQSQSDYQIISWSFGNQTWLAGQFPWSLTIFPSKKPPVLLEVND